MHSRNGYSLVEILIVVGIIALLASMSIPVYLQHTMRTKPMEAVASMTMIRQALRDYYINNSAYYDIAAGDISNQPPTASPPGAAVDVGITQYFSNSSFSVDGTSPSSARFTSPTAQGFIVTANGCDSAQCGASNCAVHADSLCTGSGASRACITLEMDNTARTYVSYNYNCASGTGNWVAY